MSKENKALAEKIIDQLGIFNKHKVEVGHSAPDEDAELEDATTVALVELGYSVSFTAKTKSAARQEAVNFLAGELDSGKLSLADNWADENLE